MRCQRVYHFVQLDYVVHADCDGRRLRCRLRVSSGPGDRSTVSGWRFPGTCSSVEVLVFDSAKRSGVSVSTSLAKLKLSRNSLGLGVHPCGKRQPVTSRTGRGRAGVRRRGAPRCVRTRNPRPPDGARTLHSPKPDTTSLRAHRSTLPAGTEHRPFWATCTAGHRPTPDSREYIPRGCTGEKKKRELKG